MVAASVIFINHNWDKTGKSKEHRGFLSPLLHPHPVSPPVITQSIPHKLITFKPSENQNIVAKQKYLSLIVHDLCDQVNNVVKSYSGTHAQKNESYFAHVGLKSSNQDLTRKSVEKQETENYFCWKYLVSDMCWWQVLFRFVASESRQKNRDLEAAASDNIYHSNSNLDHDWLQSRILSCDWSTRKKSVISQENIWSLSEWHWKNSRGHLNLPCFPSSIMRGSKLIRR